ncbi:MAG: universal stress protein [Gemmatimonadota bacterium]
MPMYRRILAAIDFSDASVDALRWTADSFPDAEITLFHAIETLRPPVYLRQVMGSDAEFELERELDVRGNLEHLAEECGIEPRISLARGWAPRRINQAAEESDSELIVVGAHTRRIWPLDAPGATASKIADKSSRPVLVWRRSTTAAAVEPRTLLAALDLREGSEPIAEMAARAALHFGARLLLLHVVSPTLQAYLRAVSSPVKVEEAFQQVQGGAREEALCQLPEELRDALEVQAIVVRGRPMTQILTLAENESADFIIIGQRHAPTRTGRVLLGRVTEIVLREANCSVLVIPV